MTKRAWALAAGVTLASCGHVDDRLVSPAARAAEAARLDAAAFDAARAGALAAARDRWREAHALRPEDPYVLSNLALAEDALGEHDAAVAHAARAVQLHPLSPALAVNQGLVLEHAGFAPRAVAAYRRALEADPGFAPAMLALGRRALADGRRDQAERHFADAVRAQPAWAEGYAGLAVVAAARGRFAEAAARMAEAAARAPANARLAAAAGALWERAGDGPRAKAALDRALGIAPRFGDALLLRAEVAWAEGDYALAERHLAAAVAADPPGEPRAGSALRGGELAAWLDQPAAAERALNLALAQGAQPAPWRGRALGMLGELALRRGAYAEARARYAAARPLLGETAAVCAGLARALHGLAFTQGLPARAQTLAEAEGWYRRALEARENAELRLMLGALYRQWGELVAAPYRRGKLRQAEMQLREALDGAPGLVAAYVELAGVLETLGRAGEAAQAYEAALARDAGATRAAFLYAELLRREGERLKDGALLARARALDAQAARADPRFAAAQLGWYLAATAPAGTRGVTEDTVVIPFSGDVTQGVPPALEDLLPFLNGGAPEKRPDGVIPMQEGDRNPLYSIGASSPAQPAATLRP